LVTTSNTSIGAINYTWDFNNGTNLSNLNNPIGIYSSPGNYTISLISENVFQCKDTSTIDISVSPILDVSFTLPDNINCRNEVLVFNSSVNFGDSVIWNFGNGDFKKGKPVWYTFPSPGIFDVSVVAYGNNGCTDTSSTSKITILPSPIADFDAYNIKIDQKPSGTIQFTNHSLLANNYTWDFGDGNSSTDIDPIHKYLHNSNSTVTLYAVNNYGCKDKLSKLIEVEFFHGLFIPATMYPGHDTFGVANFVPIGVGIKEFEILVYDDWGNLIWKSTALDADGRPSEYWNGLYDGNVNENGIGSGLPVQQDAYVWKATATFLDGSIWQGCPDVKGNISTSGSLTVIR
jgi:PKD repeat protein